MSDSLFANASVLPASSAASVGRSPMEPVMPLSTTSQARPAIAVEASGPAVIVGAEPGRPASRETVAIASSRRAAAASSAPPTCGTSKRTACRASSSTFEPPAASPTTRKRSGLRAAMSRPWVPMEPVEPRITMSRVTPDILTQPGPASVRAAHPPVLVP